MTLPNTPPMGSHLPPSNDPTRPYWVPPPTNKDGRRPADETAR